MRIYKVVSFIAALLDPCVQSPFQGDNNNGGNEWNRKRPRDMEPQPHGGSPPGMYQGEPKMQHPGGYPPQGGWGGRGGGGPPGGNFPGRGGGYDPRQFPGGRGGGGRFQGGRGPPGGRGYGNNFRGRGGWGGRGRF